MKQLTDSDLAEMVGTEFIPDDKQTSRQVRSQLRLGTLIPPEPLAVPKHVVLDLHNKTEEQAWDEINRLLRSGARTARVITGASGILKPKFQQWVKASIISPYFISCTPVNNGSFDIRIKKNINFDK